MKSNINIRRIVLYMTLVVSISACKKLIEIPPSPTNEIPESAVFSDSADIMSAIAGIYINFHITDGSTAIFNGMLSEFMGMASGELNYAYGSSFLTNTYLANDPTVTQFWNTAYIELYLINSCIAGVSSTNAISDSLKKSIIGELKTVRAFHYFYLANLFGNVPIVTSTDYKINTTLSRSPIDSVYDFIISDLTDARQVLTPAYPSEGRARPNLYTADALLARAYLYRGEYAQADAMASEVINSGLYSLPDLGDVFLDGSNEAIWQLPAGNGIFYQTTEAETFIPYSNDVIPNYQITSNILDSFDNDDQRKKNWIGTNIVNGTAYYFPFKYKNITADATPVEGYMLFRLAEQYLIRAEALAQQNKLDSALDDLDKVRNRAGLLKSMASTKSQILSAVMHERLTEFFCEWGTRWFDLKRTGEIDAILSKIKPGWKSAAALLPIPQQEMQNDPYLTQNPGY